MSMKEEDPDGEVMQGNQPTSGETKSGFEIFQVKYFERATC